MDFNTKQFKEIHKDDYIMIKDQFNRKMIVNVHLPKVTWLLKTNVTESNGRHRLQYSNNGEVEQAVKSSGQKINKAATELS